MSSPSQNQPDDFEEDDFEEDDGFDLSDNDFIDQQASIYTDYQCTQSYYYNAGILQLPVAADDSSGTTECDHIQVAAPYGQRVVNFTAEREGLTPEIPDPFEDINDNEVLLKAVVTSTMPTPMILGTSYTYQMNGTYSYGSTCPWRPAKSSGGLLSNGYLPMGKLTPIVKPGSGDTNVFPCDERFVTGIVEPSDTSTTDESASPQTDAQSETESASSDGGLARNY